MVQGKFRIHIPSHSPSIAWENIAPREPEPFRILGMRWALRADTVKVRGKLAREAALKQLFALRWEMCVYLWALGLPMGWRLCILEPFNSSWCG